MPKLYDEPMVRITFDVPKQLRQDLRVLAAGKDMIFSSYMRAILLRHVREQKQDKP